MFNPAFPKVGNFTVAAGADIGTVLGTRNGARGERELLFLGAPANYAAKIIGPAGSLRISEEMFRELPKRLRELCSKSKVTDHAENALYDIGDVTSQRLVELCDEADITWETEASAGRIEDDRRAFPLNAIKIEDADALIELDALGIDKNKRVLGATVYADVAGFTAYIDDQAGEEAEERALRVFHGIRREMNRVVRRDYDGLHVQYQGDRLQALFHLPKDDEQAIVIRAVEAAVGLQSSMIYTLPLHLPEVKALSLTIGIDVGTTLVSKLGTRGHRDRICIGEPVEAAARCEQRHCGGEIALTPRAYAALPKATQELFTKDAATGEYLAKNLTADKLERARSVSKFEAPAVHVRRDAGRVVVGAAAGDGAHPVQPARSYAR